VGVSGALVILGLCLSLMVTPAVAAPREPSQPTLLAKVPMSGIASWYRYVAGGAAAGPALRRFLGPKWRGSQVRVCALQRCVVVTLSDWCGCPGRLIDLSRTDFARLASPSRGLLKIVVTNA
jgi:hypothetical protein